MQRTNAVLGAVGAALAAAVVMASPACANLITNGSFESHLQALPPGSFIIVPAGDSTTITGWTVFGTADDVALDETNYFQSGSHFPAEDGSVSLDLTGTSPNTGQGVEQTVATNVGDGYTLTFYVGNVDNTNFNYGPTSTVGVLINGTQVTTCVNSDRVTDQDWVLCSYNFTADTASTTIGFENLDPASDFSNGLDNVSLSDVRPVRNVPEPPSLVLFATLILGLLALQRTTGIKPRPTAATNSG
jgi:hypothetical protein